jgi:5-methylcytosine-specific restriction endonuclease McrA
MFDKKTWTKANRARVNEQALAWYYRNRETVLARKDREKERVRASAWAAANRERARAKTKAWRKANPEHHNALVARTRGRVRAAACSCCVPWTFKFIYAQARALRMHVDHIKPLAKGGLHCLRNLQLLEPIDNQRKGAR